MRRDGGSMTLQELVVAVQRHRQQMAPLMYEWAGSIDDDATRQLVGLAFTARSRLGACSWQKRQRSR